MFSRLFSYPRKEHSKYALTDLSRSFYSSLWIHLTLFHISSLPSMHRIHNLALQGGALYWPKPSLPLANNHPWKDSELFYLLNASQNQRSLASLPAGFPLRVSMNRSDHRGRCQLSSTIFHCFLPTLFLSNCNPKLVIP
jgi:hypothetical protein